ncbi:MAG: RNA methyltransferase [Intestinimonas sp.]|jgi:TrmH family RNA methyltransferase|nr:RNA methyltransferase [Intestinimonas sp.]
MESITSRRNPFLVQVRKLAGSRRERRKAGLFLGEGPKLLEESLRWGAAVDTVIAGEEISLPPLSGGVRQIRVPNDVLRTLADTESPQGVLFLCRLPDVRLPEQMTGQRYLVLDGVQDPGNMGTIWRTADAFGADGLILTGSCVDPFSPKTVRATMGACFRLPVWETEPDELVGRMRLAGIPLYATALCADATDLRGAELNRAAVVVGSEGHGVSEYVLNACAGTLKIPMRDRCESLNAAVAAAVVLWEMIR